MEVYYIQTQNYTDLVVEKTEVRSVSPLSVVTQLHVRNLPLRVNQMGVTMSLNYVQGKVQVKPFVTMQQTKLKNYSIYSNMAEAAPTKSNGNNPVQNNLYSGMGTEQKHTSTPSVYDGAFVNYQIGQKINLNVNPYYYSSQVFYHHDNLTYQDGVRGVAPINAKLLLNLRLATRPCGHCRYSQVAATYSTTVLWSTTTTTASAAFTCLASTSSTNLGREIKI